VLQCAAVCFSVLQSVVVCCSVLQCGAVCCSTSRIMPRRLWLGTSEACGSCSFVFGLLSGVPCVAVCCSKLLCVAVKCKKTWTSRRRALSSGVFCVAVRVTCVRFDVSSGRILGKLSR